jgi:hypothetical protein
MREMRKIKNNYYKPCPINHAQCPILEYLYLGIDGLI